MADWFADTEKACLELVLAYLELVLSHGKGGLGIGNLVLRRIGVLRV